MKKKHVTEAYRKLIHLSSLAIPLAYRYIVDDRRVALYILIPLTIAVILVEIIRLEHKTFKRIFYRIFGIMLRRHEVSNFTGASYLLASSIVCIAFFSRDIAFLSLAFLSIGDTFAAIVGLLMGKRKIKGTKKSFEGSLACFISTLVFALFFVHPAVAITGSFAATMAELSKLPIDDNIKIPITVALVMSITSIFI